MEYPGSINVEPQIDKKNHNCGIGMDVWDLEMKHTQSRHRFT